MHAVRGMNLAPAEQFRGMHLPHSQAGTRRHRAAQVRVHTHTEREATGRGGTKGAGHNIGIGTCSSPDRTPCPRKTRYPRAAISFSKTGRILLSFCVFLRRPSGRAA